MRSILLPVLLAASAWAGMTFVHPGALDSREELDFTKAKVAAKAQPWYDRYLQMRALALAKADSTAPLDGEESAQKLDARKAYANALAWEYTGLAKYADQGIFVLNVWTKTFAGYAMPSVGQGNQSQLDAAWIGALLAPAAEILRAYPGWKSEDIAATQEMFRTRFYPILNQISPWNGNVDLTQIDAMMNIAVFNEDEAEFKLGIERLRRRDSAYIYLSTDRAGSRNYGGSSASAWSDADGNPPEKWVDGLTQETCRDNGHHAQFALASALHAAEIAWHQGVDVYTESSGRFTAALELLASQLLAGNMQGTCLDTLATADRYDTWEVGYNHYHHRKGIDLPKTRQLLQERIRIKSTSDWNIFFETLTHGDVSAPATGIRSRNAGTGLDVHRGVDGHVLLRSDRTGTCEITVLAPNGRTIARSSLTLDAGQEQIVPLGQDAAASGLLLVRVRSGAESRTFKLAP